MDTITIAKDAYLETMTSNLSLTQRNIDLWFMINALNEKIATLQKEAA